ncbi:MAG TPA: hypothetical protein VM122_05225 [Usitatibacter sp.]|nr:hypothetical protein [Usitatibacter sp.]
MTNASRALLALLVACLIAACGQAVPADKADYVGDWRGPEMRLRITREGHVEYERRRDSGSTSVNAPLLGFDGDNFSAGIGFLRTTFVVTKRPYRDGSLWKMVVDGVEVTRAEGSGPSWNT